MIDEPACPGVGEYLYQAASLGSAKSGGTWRVPLGFSPRCSRLDRTPMAGMSIETGSDRGRVGPMAGTRLAPLGPMLPAAEADGCGACCCALTATPSADPPPMTRSAPATPAIRCRMPICRIFLIPPPPGRCRLFEIFRD